MPIPVGEQTSLGAGKETTFAVAAVPTLFHENEAFNPNSKNTFMWRTGSRKSPGQRKPSTGGFDIAISLRPGTTPDTLGQLLAYAMGVQSTPALKMTSLTAYASTLSFGNLAALPSFTLEYNTGTIAIDYMGCTIDTVKLALEPNKGLSADFTIVGALEALKGSPASPTFSSKDIMMMEALGTSTVLNSIPIGTPAAPPSVLKWDLTIANNVQKTYRGAQRAVLGFPLGARKVSGTLTLGFESAAAYLLFWGGSTAPAPSVAGVPLVLNVGCQDFADSTILQYPYSFAFTMPNVYLEGAPVANKTSGALEQVVSFTAAESVGGDDLSIGIVNQTAAVY